MENQVVKTEQKSSLGLVSFDELTKDKKSKQQEELGLTLTDRALIHQGVLNLFNEFVRAKNEKMATVVTYNVWLDIVDAFKDKIPTNIQHAWRNKAKRRATTFLNQSDDLILAFKDLKVTSLENASIITQRMILTDIATKAMFKLTGIGGNWTPSKTPITYLAYIKPFSFEELGMNHKMKVSEMNNVQLKHFLTPAK